MNLNLTCLIFASTFGLYSLPLFAKTKPADVKAGAEELIQSIKDHDPSIARAPDPWHELEEHIRKAAALAESPQGFARSLEDILAHHKGKGLRIVQDSEPAYYAYESSVGNFLDAGLLFAQRGARWYVKQMSHPAQPQIHRGDAVMLDSFHPQRSLTGSSVSLRLQSQAMSPAKDLRVPLQKTSLAAAALLHTQKESQLLPLGGKKICREKLWLWLSPEVDAALRSKLAFAADHCDALLLDVRDAGGPGAASLSEFKTKRSFPIAVLINRETREGAVSLALQLKQSAQAQIFGEPSASRQLPEEHVRLKQLPWLLVFYPEQGGSLIPDQMVDDSWMYAEGFDGVQEKALKYLQDSLSH